MGSDVSDFLGLGQDFQQLIVGQEVESGKDGSLLLEIVGETFLDDFKVLVCLLELFLETLSAAASEDRWVSPGGVDALSPGGVDRLEALVLSRELLSNIR